MPPYILYYPVTGHTFFFLKHTQRDTSKMWQVACLNHHKHILVLSASLQPAALSYHWHQTADGGETTWRVWLLACSQESTALLRKPLQLKIHYSQPTTSQCNRHRVTPGSNELNRQWIESWTYMYISQRKDPKECPSACCYVPFRRHPRAFRFKGWVRRKGWQDVWLVHCVRRLFLNASHPSACW